MFQTKAFFCRLFSCTKQPCKTQRLTAWLHVQGKRRSELLNKLLALYPPVLHRWFLARFPEPATWHRARLAFTRTTAVWSMVGHIVGLGDRHGENILLDATTGDCVHVDFAFLFDRVSAGFAWPPSCCLEDPLVVTAVSEVNI